MAGRQQPPAGSPAESGGGGGGGGGGPQPEWPAPEQMGSEGRAGEGTGCQVTDELILAIIQGVLSQVRVWRVWWVVHAPGPCRQGGTGAVEGSPCCTTRNTVAMLAMLQRKPHGSVSLASL